MKRILIVGYGSIGTRHLRVSRALFPEAKIMLLRHKITSVIPEFSDGCFFKLEDALNFEPQIAVIANPATFHLEIAQELVENGAHLFIEKPLSSSVEGTSKLIDLCKENKKILAVGYNMRFMPSLQKLRQFILEGKIGNPISFRSEVGQFLPTWRPESDYTKSVSARSELGGGVLLELSHEFDYLRWIFGEIEWVRATLSQQSDLKIDVEDTAHLTLGIEGKDESAKQLIGTLNMDFIRRDPIRVCTIIGDKGTLHWNGLEGEVSFFENGATSWEVIFSHSPSIDETYFAEWRDFIHSIASGVRPASTGEDGANVLRVIEAARKSAETGIQVPVSRSHYTNELTK